MFDGSERPPNDGPERETEARTEAGRDDLRTPVAPNPGDRVLSPTPPPPNGWAPPGPPERPLPRGCHPLVFGVVMATLEMAALWYFMPDCFGRSS